MLDTTRAELVRGLEQRYGSIYKRIHRIVIVAGYALDRAFQRERGLRRDGCDSLLAMAVALLYLADIRSGFIGKPSAGGGHWHRYTLADLAQLAYGAQSAAELRRARRAIDMMISLGWAYRTKQVRRYRAENDSFVGLPGVRRLNFTRICEVCGTTWLLKRDRIHADKTKGDNVALLQTPKRGQQRIGQRADQDQERRAQAAQLRHSRGTGDPGGGGPPGIGQVARSLFDKG